MEPLKKRIIVNECRDLELLEALEAFLGHSVHEHTLQDDDHKPELWMTLLRNYLRYRNPYNNQDRPFDLTQEETLRRIKGALLLRRMRDD